MKLTKADFDEMMKPQVWTCMKCGGDLHVIPYKEKVGRKIYIKTMNICGKCSFEKKGGESNDR